MKLGQRVFHPTFGRGVIVGLDEVGARRCATVDFDYTKVCVAFDALRVIPEPAGLPQPPDQSVSPGVASLPVQSPTIRRALTGPSVEGLRAQPTVPAPATGPASNSVAESPSVPSHLSTWPTAGIGVAKGTSQTRARKGVVALRLGQILETLALQLTVGTEDVQRDLKSALHRALDGRPTFVLVEGAWGGGKTHALTLLQALARQEKVVTCGAVMDGVAASLAGPMSLMEELLNSLRFPGNSFSGGPGPLLRQAKVDGQARALRDRGARRVADALEALPMGAFDDPEGLQCIEDYFCFSLAASSARAKLRLLGHQAMMLPSLRSRRRTEQPPTFARLLAEWAHVSAALGGHGLLVVLDELDVEYAATSWGSGGYYQGLRMMRRDVLGQMKALSQHRAPLLVALAAAPASPDVAVHDDAVQDVCEALGPALSYHVRAAQPSETDLRELLSGLVALFSEAYSEPPLALTDNEVAQLFTGLLSRHMRLPMPVPRHFVRTAIEVFDLLTAGGATMEEVLRLLKAS